MRFSESSTTVTSVTVATDGGGEGPLIATSLCETFCGTEKLSCCWFKQKLAGQFLSQALHGDGPRRLDQQRDDT
jgi:hypothetical protein